MASTTKTKQIKAKSVPAGNASRHGSKKPKQSGVSRIKKCPDVLQGIIDQANTASGPVDYIKIFREDEVLKELEARLDEKPTRLSRADLERVSAAHKARRDELLATWGETHILWLMRESLLQAIDLAKTGDINYLRQCENCDKIFFAGRKDQTGCSPACLNKIRKLRWKRQYDNGVPGYYK